MSTHLHISDDQFVTTPFETKPSSEPAPAAMPASASSRGASRAQRVAFACALSVLVLAILAARGGIGWLAAAEDRSAPVPAAAPSSAEIESTYGVRITSVVVTAGGGMIQLRYQILDQGLAEALHAEAAPTVVAADGTVFGDPGIAGHAHLGRTSANGATDALLLADARGSVQPGDIVTVRIGDLELGGIRVQ